MSHLLLVSIGPVQDFIASARRCRDLWYGSYLLSELAKGAARAILKSENGRPDSLIFPAPNRMEELEPGSSLNVANKILARVENPTVAAQSAIAEVQVMLSTGIEEALRAFGDCPYLDREPALSQIVDLPEIYWVSLSETGNWRHDRTRVEALMASRKNLRAFGPVTWGSERPKCTLDGLRETVLDLSRVQDMPAEEMRRRFGVRRGEYLCGVALLKRQGARGQHRTASTSHLASLPFLDGLGSKAEVESLVEALRSYGISDEDLGNVEVAHPVFGRHDGHILYEERLADFVSDPTRLSQARSSLRAFLRRVGRRPGPYYAILLADGDRMGAALDSIPSPDQHRSFSQKLASFASEARAIIRRCSGSPVYAGGDDVLALVPLHRALECSKLLADDFRNRLAGIAPKDQPTLSVGLAVIHHLDSLSDGLTLARRMESLAKRTRNSLAIGVSKRSGSVTECAGHWDQLDKRLTQWISLHRGRLVPRGVPYELRQLDLKLSGVSRELLRIEADRVLRRKQPEAGRKTQLEQDVLKALLQGISSDGGSVTRLAEELIIAEVFADSLDTAGMEIVAR